MKAYQYPEFFAKEEVMVVLTTSVAGLGHKRVTAALKQGLPGIIREEELGNKDPWMQALHRIGSRNFYLRLIAEYVQNSPVLERHFTHFYRNKIRQEIKNTYQKIKNLVERRGEKPKVVLIVSTHFSLAHELAETKLVLSRELKLKIILVVVVTDDSPQKLWAVPGADYTFVPSYTTKSQLLDYFKEANLEPVPEIIVKPYPVSLWLGKKLTEAELKARIAQVKPTSQNLKVMVPISGAAVQLKYLKEMIEALYQGKQMAVTIVTREAKSTKDFIAWAQDHPGINVIAKTEDEDVVGEYEEEYLRNIYAIEITKPSEQAFKTLFSPKQRGGVIMFFSDPVGRQEDDNVKFMTRHGLLPNEKDAELMRQVCLGKTSEIDSSCLLRARSWRGILLPMEGAIAGHFIRSLHKAGVLEAMTNFKGYVNHEELTSNGVEQIWQYLEQKTKALLK